MQTAGAWTMLVLTNKREETADSDQSEGRKAKLSIFPSRHRPGSGEKVEF